MFQDVQQFYVYRVTQSDGHFQKNKKNHENKFKIINFCDEN